MVFNSFQFLIFFAVVAIVLVITNSKRLNRKYKEENIIKFRQIFLLIASYYFYGSWNWKCAFLMLALTLVSYISAILIEKKKRKVYLLLGVVAPLIVLGIFKYFNFFLESFYGMFNLKAFDAINIILPVGISFYTFQSLSYTIDVYREKVKAEHSFIKLALYISFFPQLVAGPIVKANDFIPQLYENRKISWKNFAIGIQYFVFGLFKKVVIADNIAPFIDTVYESPNTFHAITLILAVIGYSIQIYCDFSGYSDMAIGCAKCIGYDLERNFNMPYISRNISEFWRRWHISLSTWLKEYVYIPLGGNRKGKIRTYVNNFITMVIGGLWHGASWTFVAWGALNGLALCVHKMVTGKVDKNKQEITKVKKISVVFSTILTYMFVCLCWILFRATDFENAWDMILGIFTWKNGVIYYSTWTIFGIIAMIICSTIAIVKSKKEKTQIEGFYPVFDLTTIKGLTILFLTVGFTLGLAYVGNNPFIYFQF